MTKRFHTALMMIVCLVLSAGIVIGDSTKGQKGRADHFEINDRETPGRYSGPWESNPVLDAYSADLHVHGSFSELSASMRSTTVEIKNQGVDVIWWSDHDGFFTNYHFISSFSFDSWTEASWQNEAWIPNRMSETRETKFLKLESLENLDMHEAVIDSQVAYEGIGSLHLTGVSSQPGPGFMSYRFAGNNMNKRPLAADVTLEVAIFPEQAGRQSSAVVEIILSKHEADRGSGWEQLSLRYILSDGFATAPYREGSVYTVPLEFVSDEWNTYQLPITEDATKGFSYMTGIDNSLYQINLGIQSSFGDTVDVYFDALKISTGLVGDPLLEVQRMIMDSLEKQAPDINQLQGIETKFKHLNIFGSDLSLPDYDSIAIVGGFMDASGWIHDFEGFQVYCAEERVRLAHERGNIVSYNHMFGPSSDAAGGLDPEMVLDELAAHSVYGADLLEVGYRARGGQDLNAHLWVWDELAKQQIYLVGTGVTDSHDMAPGLWDSRENNLVSWIYSESGLLDDLMVGLRGGRVYFGDITMFDGIADITTPEGFVMGQIIVTDKVESELTLSFSDLEPGDQVRTYRAGGLVNTYTVDTLDFIQTETHPIDSLGTFVRAVVTDPSGEEKVLTNPIYFTRQPPAMGISPDKAGLDLGGIHSTLVDEFTITDASFEVIGQSRIHTIGGTGTSGTIVLNIALTDPPDSVTFEGLTGLWEISDSLVVLYEINGTGSIRIFGGSVDASTAAFRVNTGGAAYTSTEGIFFSEDREYVPGGFGYVGGEADWIPFDVEGTEDDTLYRSYLEADDFGYLFDLSLGSYAVTLHFVEPRIANAGERRFDVGVDSVVVLDSLDLFSAAGGRLTAFDTTFVVSVVDSQLSIEFNRIPETRPALISAIEVVPLAERVSNLVGETVPATYRLEQNYPNPFNPRTRINYSLAENGHVRIVVYDLVGRKVKGLVDAHQERGEKAVHWDGRDDSGVSVSSGVYFYRIVTGNFTDVRKMILLK